MAATVAVVSVAGIVSKTIDTVLRHRRKQQEPIRLLADRFAEGQLDEFDYLRAWT